MVFLVTYEIIMIIIELKLLKDRFISISFISTITLLMSTIAVIYTKNRWNIDIGNKTILVLVVGIFIAFVAEMMSSKLIFSKELQKKANNSIQQININKSTILIINFIVIMCTVLFLADVMTKGKSLGGKGLDCISIVKQTYLLTKKDPLNPLIRQLFKVIMALAYFFIYVLICNYLVVKKAQKEFGYYIPIICGVIITIVSGSRGDILKLLAAGIMDYYIIYFHLNQKKLSNRQIFEFIRKFLPLIFGLLVILFFSRNIVKIKGTQTSEIGNGLEYISFYAGNSIAVLDKKISLKYSNGGFWYGNEMTLPSFVYIGDLDYGGNVATIFGKTLFKYGFIDMCIYIFIVYFINGFLIHLLEKNMAIKNGISIRTIVMSYVYSIFIFSFYDDLFYDFFKLTNVLTIILIVMVCLIFKKYRFAVQEDTKAKIYRGN